MFPNSNFEESKLNEKSKIDPISLKKFFDIVLKPRAEVFGKLVNNSLLRCKN